MQSFFGTASINELLLEILKCQLLQRTPKLLSVFVILHMSLTLFMEVPFLLSECS